MGFYATGTRYYDPEISRFINADTTDILDVSGNLYDKNLYAYCDNNPIVRVDVTGYAWETVFDVASLVFSAVEVCVNPTDLSAWIGLMGDTVDLIPFVTGVGETIRALRTTEKVADGVDTTIDTYRNLRKLSKGTGKEVHHILEKRFWAQLDLTYKSTDDMLAITLTKNQHAKYTKVFRKLLPYGQRYTEDQIINSAAKAYSNDSQLMGTILYSLLKRK